MPVDTASDSSAIPLENILAQLHEELGDAVPQRCEIDPAAPVQDIYFEGGAPRFVTFACNHRLMVQPESGGGEHRWRR